MLTIKHREPYAKLRQQEYPSVADQLDMLWHSMNNGEMTKLEPFYTTIKNIKEKYKKDE